MKSLAEVSWFHLDVVSSTQDEVRSRLAHGAGKRPLTAPWAAVVGVSAGHQTKGRGRRGRVWADTPGSMIFSAGFLDDVSEKAFPVRVAKSAAAALHQTVSHFVHGAAVSIKWPNDILVAGRKVAGVLVETVARRRQPRITILGIGANVLDAPPDLPDAAAISIFAQSVTVAAFRELFLQCLDALLLDASKAVAVYEAVVTLPEYIHTPKGDGRPLRYNNGVVTVATRSGVIDVTDAEVLVVEG